MNYLFRSAKNGIIDINENLLRFGVQKDKNWLENQASEQIFEDPDIFEPEQNFKLVEIYGEIKRSKFEKI